MKKERSSHSKIKALKILNTYVLVRDMLRMHLSLFVSKSVVLFQKRAHPIFLYKEIGCLFLETGHPLYHLSQAHLVTLFPTYLFGFGKSLGVDSR
ncbi:hypothetical protein M9H77_06625 [Catharanthus roseus]|uniref:Uncharacterized protein n=1 Tax=Catharanthus roseus TaxID=4058 RepID=A0ACC0BSS0_CATRO|nr:hypothetical protein M9H77_06625 [Catharanthus roseus]